MIAAGRDLVGDNPLGIRLATVLTGLLGPILLWRTVSILFGASVAVRAVWFALAMPLLTVGGIIMTPDTPSVLFWGLTGWATAELYASRNPNWWLAIGLFLGPRPAVQVYEPFCRGRHPMVADQRAHELAMVSQLAALRSAACSRLC